MRTAWLVASALALGACAGDTAIVLELHWVEDTNAPPADTLRIFVGTETGEPAVFAANAGGKALAVPVPPYRYALRPGGDVAAIGPLQLAAALTTGPEARPLLFAAAADLVEFADGEVRTVVLTLEPHTFAVSGDAQQCVTWSAEGNGGLDHAIGTDGDADCDTRVDGADCQMFNPFVKGDNKDGDSAVCNDCLDDDQPVILGGWSIDAGSVFPGQTEEGFRAANLIPDNVECLHIDYDCTGGCEADNVTDLDGSGTDTCGRITFGPEIGACPAAPSDCDENVDGDTAVFGDGEICDGADQSCDREPAPALPCPLPGPEGCTVGVDVCNDARGVYLGCQPVDFPLPLDPGTCGALQRTDACRFDEDPLDCAGGTRDACTVGIGGPLCDRERLRMPGAVGANGCNWRVIGGTDHAEWRVGYSLAADGSGALVEATTACAPFLVVRAVHPNPARRTVMIVGQSSIGDVSLARFIRLEPSEDAAACDGLFHCVIAKP